MRRRPWFWFVLIGVLTPVGCAKSRAPISVEVREDGSAIIDNDVMAYLSLARSLHHQANLSEDDRDVSGAIAPLEHLVHVPKPHEGTQVPEVEEVLADTYARMAELRLRTNDLAAAEADVREGLAHAPDPTYFRGHLLEVLGVIDEARASSLADAGQIAQAEEARKKARELLKQAVSVQEEVLAHATLDASPEGGRK
jgi:tetratricopeptide (TPR) repeat protein